MAPPSAAANAALVRRLIEDGWNTGDAAVFEEVMAPELAPKSKQSNAALRAAFAGWHHTIDELLVDGDQVVVRLTWTGIHRGAYDLPMVGAIPPTGKRITFTGIGIFRTASGRIVGSHSCWDRLGVLQQLGALVAAVPLEPPTATVAQEVSR